MAKIRVRRIANLPRITRAVAGYLDCDFAHDKSEFDIDEKLVPLAVEHGNMEVIGPGVGDVQAGTEPATAANVSNPTVPASSAKDVP